MISNSSITYNVNSTNTHIILNDLLFSTVYNISVAAVNSVGRGPFSDPIVVEIGIIPGPVESLSSIMDATWSVISWSVPSFIPQDYPIITFEIGYLSDNCSIIDVDDIDDEALDQYNVSSGNRYANITGLNHTSCYIFGVRAYTDNGYGEWIFITNKTLSHQPSASVAPTLDEDGETDFAFLGTSSAIAGFSIMMLLLVIIVATIYVKKKISSTRTHLIKEVASESQGASILQAKERDVETVLSYLTVWNDFDPQIPPTLPIPLDDLATHLDTCHNSNGFEKQFKNLYSGEEKPCTVGYSDENKPLNRLKNVTVYDDNRIILTANPDLDMCQREFINANYVDGYSRSKKYVTTQGPMKNTLVDFWYLIWQERPVSIVMLTKLKEGGKSKCRQYWPNAITEQEKFGPFIVLLKNTQAYSDFVTRQLCITIQDGSNDSHTLTQYHLTTWPDQGVPDYATSLMTLYKRVMNTWSPSQGPILVHCSAGIGRTGIFIAIDLALEQAKKEGVIDFAGIINRLRQQRMKMVQSLDQYVFLHDAVFEEIICGKTDILIENYTVEIQKLKKNDPSINCTGIEAQYHLLCELTPDPNDVECKSANAHSNKNRSNNYLPPDKYIITLKDTNDDYINASYLKGYQGKKEFIIAQSPMENTVREFWKMIVDCKVSTIVMLCGDEDCCYQYWTGSKTHGEFSIEVISKKIANGYTERNLKISFDKESRSVLQLQVTDWPQDGVVRKAGTILQVINDVRNRQKKGPVVVHCSDTVSRSGVYCSVSIALEQCKAEGIVDVFQVTKTVRRTKPGAVTTLEQYNSIYDVINLYIQTTYK
ncbi:PREDICTED: receptor-type tyrosine-protein phosphatase F-like isoform X2 [Amphimedon queenslandica]|uniref:protein-tyrosine-phosphatase n=1 Tax=Amphimedon queenslandica TaxID=400682 RepID=A0AAN0JEY1_AMPQE|nr:PREDICTED: receptor-type tyrosine-protein phosphatase F-like isoform X2 [Amphimedon queenslandica]|eukprot:XP_019855327.1 PREDICTED: receptor-type tyrosine-protein phosphatase F-like isoform X2 [Amphimedon queenslandica]